MRITRPRINVDHYCPEAVPTRRHELTGGHWVKQDGRGLRVWVENAQPPDVEALEPVSWRLRPETFVCHCGCLLQNDTETCPACLIWAENAAWMASWRTDYYQPATKEAAA